MNMNIQNRRSTFTTRSFVFSPVPPREGRNSKKMRTKLRQRDRHLWLRSKLRRV